MRKFLRSFRFAAEGVIACAAGERNMRVHLCAAFYALALMPFYDFSRAEKIAVAVVIGMVISAEAMNTAVEALTDLASPDRCKLAKLAKDAAAAAVLITAVTAAAVGFVLYFDTDTLGEIFRKISGDLRALAAVILSAAAWAAFICAPLGSVRNKKITPKKTNAHDDT